MPLPLFQFFLRCKNNFTDFYILIDIAYLVCFHSVKINVWTHYDTIAWSCYFWNRALLVKAFIYKHFVTIGSIIILENVLFMLFEVLCFPLHFRKLHMTHCFYLVVLRTWDFKNKLIIHKFKCLWFDWSIEYLTFALSCLCVTYYSWLVIKMRLWL